MTKILEPGSELDGGKYKIVRLLGEGGMGTVFEAEQRETQKRVAIKCLHPHQAGDPEIGERLLREARATARIRHPNVVDIYDVGRDGPIIYLVMEYLDGETFSKAIERADLPAYVAIGLLIDAMRGVVAAHNQGIIHRDIKPDNIFLAKVTDAPRPVVKVLDFGISKLAGKTPESRSLTRSGMAIGTPSYMSYEQLAGERDLDARADVYAFGVILYETLTGKVPYDAVTFPELLMRFTTRPPVPPKQLRPEIPRTLNRVVMWAIEKERQDRIGSVDALLRELEPFAQRYSYEAEQTGADHLRTPYPEQFDVTAAQSGSALGRAKPRTASSVTVPGKSPQTRMLLLLAAAAVIGVGAWLTHAAQQKTVEVSVSPATVAPLPPVVPAQTGAINPLDELPIAAPPPPSREQEAHKDSAQQGPEADAKDMLLKEPLTKDKPDSPIPHGRTPPTAAPAAPRVNPPPPSSPAPRKSNPRPRDIGIY
ncbi:MAG TPA: serine/threonine-protein kinase [Polyangiales bacterium]|nr:serine/threonine-protein kinase [Polyangiales bacterium]